MDSKILLQDLANGVCHRSGLAKREGDNFVRAFFAVIEQYLQEDKIVKIKGLGTFKVIEVSGRDSINVNTGERFHIQGHSKITFTPDSALRDHVNRPFADFETIILNDGVDLAEMEYVEPQVDDENEDAGASAFIEDDILPAEADSEASADVTSEESESESAEVQEGEGEAAEVHTDEGEAVEVEKEGEQEVVEVQTDEQEAAEVQEEGEAAEVQTDEQESAEVKIEEAASDENDAPVEEVETAESETAPVVEDDASEEDISAEENADSVCEEESAEETVSKEESAEEETVSEEESAEETVSKEESAEEEASVEEKETPAEEIVEEEEVVEEAAVKANNNEKVSESSEDSTQEDEPADLPDKNTDRRTWKIVARTVLFMLLLMISYWLGSSHLFVCKCDKIYVGPQQKETTEKTKEKPSKPAPKPKPAATATPPVGDAGGSADVSAPQAEDAKTPPVEASAQETKPKRNSGKRNNTPVEVTAQSDSTKPVIGNPSDYPQVKSGDYEIVGVKCVHVLQSGETISKLSRKYLGGVEMNVYIIKLNDLKRPDLVKVGQEFKIPELRKK